jgi:hypothetical protein
MQKLGWHNPDCFCLIQQYRCVADNLMLLVLSVSSWSDFPAEPVCFIVFALQPQYTSWTLAFEPHTMSSGAAWGLAHPPWDLQ